LNRESTSQPERPLLALVILAVRDVARAIAFYRACFDWKQTVDEEVYAEFQTEGGFRIGLYEQRAFEGTACCKVMAAPEGQLTGVELYFYVDDITRVCQQFMTAGAHQSSPRSMRHWGEEAAYFKDLDGHLLVVAKRLT